MYAAQNAVLLYVRSTPILIVDDEEFDVLAGLLEPELALEPARDIPRREGRGREAAHASNAEASAKSHRSSCVHFLGHTAAHDAPAAGHPRGTCMENRSDVSGCQRAASTAAGTVTEMICSDLPQVFALSRSQFPAMPLRVIRPVWG